MSKIMEKALNMLNELISEGKEFPDAEWKVCKTFLLSEKQMTKLVELYDQQ